MNSATARRPRIDAIVVTFHADVARLEELLQATAWQVDHIHVVENGNGAAIRATVAARPAVSLLVLGQNFGIAAAQNAGVRAAIKAGAEFILLLDQDSVPQPLMVAQLLAAHDLLSEQGHRMAAVGPRAPSRGSPGAFVRFDWFRYCETSPHDSDSWVFCDLLIASGLLIPVPVLNEVGPMDESLFIDKVDTEWCLRVAARGYRLAGVPAATLAHSLGEHTLSVGWGLGRKHIAAHKPFRYYYIIRNGILVSRRSYPTWRWRSADMKQSVKIVLLFGLVYPARWQNLRMMLRGAADALLGRSGPMPRPSTPGDLREDC